MRKKGTYIQITISALDVFIKGMAHPHFYAATDEFSRLVIAVDLYDGVTWRNLTDFIKSLNKEGPSLALEK